MTFAPRIEMGVRLAQSGIVHAMMDISDGLSRDLPRLLGVPGSNLGAVIDGGAVPIHGDAEELSRQDGRTALEHALHDGEDYELLLACAAPARETGLPGDARRPPPSPSPGLPGEGKDMAALFGELIEIGVVTAAPGIFLQTGAGRIVLEPLGWQHRL
jgi:thiamine-monophosphate kinase